MDWQFGQRHRENLRVLNGLTFDRTETVSTSVSDKPGLLQMQQVLAEAIVC